jgi:hypothetical protein
MVNLHPGRTARHPGRRHEAIQEKHDIVALHPHSSLLQGRDQILRLEPEKIEQTLDLDVEGLDIGRPDSKVSAGSDLGSALDLERRSER